MNIRKKIVKAKLNKLRLNGPKENETYENYLERNILTDKDRVLYFETLITEIFKRNPDAALPAMEPLKDKNPVAYKIMMDKYLELKGGK